MVCLTFPNLRRISLLTVFFLTAFTSPVFAQFFTINRFHSDITINKDASFIVKETLDVEFHMPRHGIFREIPFKYVTELGKTIKTPIKVISVTDESGGDWKYKVAREGNIISIRIGDPDRYVSGLQTYVITYKVENATLFFDDHDELYWNVTGNYWPASIKEASTDITLAVQDNKNKLFQGSCYTGVLGSTESECIFEKKVDGGKFFTRKTFNPGEGFTIALGWDKGLVVPPSNWKQFLWKINIKENWVFSLPFLSLITMITLWSTLGRDPRVRKSVVVMYEPPRYKDKPLSAAEVGTLIDDRVNPRDLSAAIVGLAVKGYIKIEETRIKGLISIFDSIDYKLVKIKEPDLDLSYFEIQLMRSLFLNSQSSINIAELQNTFYEKLPSLKDTLYNGFVQKGYFRSDPAGVRKFYLITGFLIILFFAFGLAILSFAPFISFAPFKGIIAGILTGIPILAFATVMPAKTRVGALAYMHLLGFIEFLMRAEKDRLERMGDKELFSKFLPYAIALDVVDNWTKAFEGIYQEPPKWFVSMGEPTFGEPTFRGPTTFTPRSFSRSIETLTSSLSSKMFSAPRGSSLGGGGFGGGGFGGGGSSGGGFGGGGGRSW
ncbi:MAG TPA: DUF2207 domain-containing protein [Candidatus Hypogeohydataceae bacterium YC41]